MLHFDHEKSHQFYIATMQGNLERVKDLSLDPQVDLNFSDRDGFTALLVASRNGYVEVVRFLLNFKDPERTRTLDCNLMNHGGDTPLNYACFNGHDHVVQILLADARVDVNQPNTTNKTPLWWSASHGSLGIVKLLLASGRQLNTATRNVREGKTAAEIAKEKGKEAVANLIWAFEKDPLEVTFKLRLELGYSDSLVGELFALVVYLSDGYLKFPEDGRSDTEEGTKAERFLSLATRLPMELQMVLCNRTFGRGGSFTKQCHSEQGFRKFARPE